MRLETRQKLTSRQTDAKAYTSLYVEIGGGRLRSSSKSARSSSGAIHLVDPAKKDVGKSMKSETSSFTLASPKSVITAHPSELMRMLP